MTFRKFCFPIIVVSSLAILSACEKAEEKLTPPASHEKSGPKVISTGKAKTAEVQPAMLADAAPTTELIPEQEFGEETTDTLTASDSLIESEEMETSEILPTQPVALFPPELLERASAHICFFSFNTGAEYIQLKRMVKQLNAASDIALTITEYQIMDSDPYDNFVDLLKSGKQCDGVVLSGHHTDEFYGERTDGDLEIEDLEELACEPRYAPWFANIKALWLQGCNTVKAGVTNTEVDEDERISGSPIQHMQRLLDPEDMEDSIEDMRDLLYENTNEENLVNDYMRVFSGATVYGWSNIAPGEMAGAQKSIPFHLAQVSRLVENDPRYFQNPLQTTIPELAAQRYSQVLYGLLTRPNRPDARFPEKLSEKTLMQGWRDHGDVRNRYAFDNHDIEAFPALGNSNNEVLRQLKGLTCLLHQLDDRLDDMSMMQVAEYILRDRALTSYNSYLLWAMLRSLPVDSAEYRQLQARLVNDDHLTNELRFSANGSGYSQQDAKQMLTALGTSIIVARPDPEKNETEDLAVKAITDAQVPEPAAKTVATESGRAQDVSTPAPVSTLSGTNVDSPAIESYQAPKAVRPSPVAITTPAPVNSQVNTPPPVKTTQPAIKTGPVAEPAPTPWYMNESAASEDEQEIEFTFDTHG